MKIKSGLSAACDGSPPYRLSRRCCDVVYGAGAQIFEKKNDLLKPEE
jgi:hypothetical protein